VRKRLALAALAVHYGRTRDDLVATLVPMPSDNRSYAPDDPKGEQQNETYQQNMTVTRSVTDISVSERRSNVLRIHLLKQKQISEINILESHQ
jgi:hypothetical protein